MIVKSQQKIIDLVTRPAGTKSVLEILAERESIFRLLPQTTSENIAKDYKNYTVDPTTRYPNLNKYLYSSHQMEKLYIYDDGTSIFSPINIIVNAFLRQKER